MLAVSHRSSSSLPTAPRSVMDEPGTIDPAALNAPASTIAPNLLSQPSPHGIKRSRSSDGDGASDRDAGDRDDAKNAKRNKLRAGASPATASNMSPATGQPVQTPQIKTEALPQPSPSQTSPQRSTPSSATKQPVVKALPTVRDHTTDQLGPEGDEYIPREIDVDGESKVSKDGYALDGRKYKCRTFQVPNRGEKLFMLATECARVLGYRDSYLLFNKNRSLYKIIANQPEKDNLIHQGILPHSYRSRQIAIVTARSMFRQFGSRLIEGGRRVRDDYWEAKAIKQGFTEEDAAGEKRPGAARAREQAAAEASNTSTLTSLPQGEIIYSNGHGLDGQPPGMASVSLAPLPMIHLPSEELRSSTMGNVVRPRQDLSTNAFIDRSQPSSATEILNQATQAAEYNKALGQTRAHRARYLDDYWRRPHEQPVTEPPPGPGDMNTVAPQNLQSPHTTAAMVQHPRTQQDPMAHHGSQMIPPSYSAYMSQPNTMTSPVQQMHRQLPPTQAHQTSPSVGVGPAGAHRQQMSYGGYSNQMWPPPQPQPSPLSQSHQLSHYGQQQQQHQQQQQPQQQHHHSPMAPPQMPPQQQQQPGGMAGYPQMNQMSSQAYASMQRAMYQPPPNPGAQQYNMGNMQSSAGQQPGMQGWANPGAGNMPQNYGFQ